MSGVLPAGVVTFLFTDIEGSSKLWERQPTLMREALAVHDQILADAVAQSNGSVFKTVGDAFCCAFADPKDAVFAAIGAQRTLQSREWPPGIGEIRVRAGVHSGSAVQRDGDYFGPTLNRTARLMAIAYGGQILVSSATAALLRDVLGDGVVLRDLGTHRLKDLSQPEPTFQVVAPGLRTEFPALNTIDSRPNNLPSQISSFVGRENELAELKSLLSAQRLVTIAGPGGMGKTRVALQLAASVLEGYPDGAWFIDLSALKDGSLVSYAIAGALCIREVPQEPIGTTLVSALREKTALLVIDNAEHLLSAVSEVVSELTARCPGVSLLVTSREPLHVAGEHVYRLEPMSGAPDGVDPALLTEHDATRLFVERAREVAPKLSLGPEDTRAVVSLCRRVDGIPLAIELAAARVGLLSIRQLDRRLADGLAALAPRGTEDSRHRTLEATIDWSYRLLTDDEKRLFDCLGIFSDGFTLEACEAIAPAASLSSPLLDVLQSLIDKSLVTASTSGDTARYAMLEAIHEFSDNQRRQSEAFGELQQLHFAFYAQLVKRHTEAGSAAARNAWIESVSADLSNCRAALEWSLEANDARAGELLCGLAVFWQSVGQLTEGRKWLDLYVARAEAAEAAYPRVLRFAAFFAASRDDHQEALRLTSELLHLAQDRDDALLQGEALHTQAVVEQRRGNAERSIFLFESALALFRKADNRRNALVALLNLSNILMVSSSLERSAAFLDEAEGLARNVGDDELTGLALGLRASLALQLGRLEEAERLFGRALAVQRACRSARRIEDLNSLAEVRAKQGALSDARALVAESLALSLPLDEHHNIIRSIEIAAYVSSLERSYDEAARLLAVARALRGRYAYRTQPLLEMAELEADLTAHFGSALAHIMEDGAAQPWRTIAESLLPSTSAPQHIS